MLKIENIQVAYGEIQVVWDVSLNVPPQFIVALLGSNGAGKTTTLKSVMGLLPPLGGKILFQGESIVGKAPHEIVNSGLTLVPEWRGTFSSLTVLENLELGAFPPRARPQKDKTLREVVEIYPRLAERK
jgi:branched-chain amino acid transport system ATP-binding protein